MRVVTGLLLSLAGCDLVFELHDQVGSCPAEYMAIGDSFYAFHQVDPAPWVMAQALCKAEGAGSSKHTHLVVIGSPDENAALVLSGQLDPGADDSWIGLSDALVEGQFEWVTAEPMARPYPDMDMEPPWGPSEPNDAGTEDCVAIASDGVFNDVFCPSARPYVCECDAFPSRDD